VKELSTLHNTTCSIVTMFTTTHCWLLSSPHLSTQFLYDTPSNQLPSVYSFSNIPALLYFQTNSVHACNVSYAPPFSFCPIWWLIQFMILYVTEGIWALTQNLNIWWKPKWIRKSLTSYTLFETLFTDTQVRNACQSCCNKQRIKQIRVHLRAK